MARSRGNAASWHYDRIAVTSEPTQFVDFPASLQWLDRPALSRATGLRGHVLAIVSWRLGCVHSRQALAEFAALQRTYAGRAFAVVAVHSPCQPAEHDLARLRRVLAERTVPITVAIDAAGELRRLLGHRCLPGLALVDTDGAVRFVGHGEPNRLRVEEAIESLLERAERNGTAARVPFVPGLLPAPVARPLLPSAIASDGETLWVACAGHRRVYEVDKSGTVLRTIGSGQPGTADGPAATASFHTPIGLLTHGDHLVVADAGAHTLRAVHRQTGEVATWCGNGRRNTDRFGGAFGDQQGLCSPVAMAALDGGIYVSQAGAHQVWQFDPETQAATAWIGTGARSLRDGGEEATFAEPWGIAVREDAVFLADASNGALRRVDLGHNFVRTVAQGLARPMGLVVHGADVFVADAWQAAVVRWCEGAELAAGFADRKQGLVEPVALTIAGDELWIADVGANCLFVADLPGSGALRRVELSGWPALPQPAHDERYARFAEPLQALEFSDVTLRIELPLADGEQLDAALPCQVSVLDEGVPVLACDRNASVSIEDGCAVMLVPISDRGHGALRVRVEATVRAGASAQPRQRTWRYVVPVEVGTAGGIDCVVRALSERT